MEPWQSRFESPPSPDEFPQVRRRIQALLEEKGLQQSLIDHTGLLISELAHNAFEAADGDSDIVIELAYDARGLELTVECAGNRDLETLQRALDSSTVLPGPESERGRGLWLVLNLSRKLEVRRARHGHVQVRLLVKGD